MEDAPEIWKPVVGFEGLYEVSDLGRVYSIRSGRVLRSYPTRKTNGYAMISLYENGQRFPRLVHVLVARAFIGPGPEGAEVRHFPDFDIKNNRASNLMYGTRQENVDDTVQADRHSRGSRNGVAKLDEKHIREIRKDPRMLKDIASDYGVHFATISAVKLGKTWKHV